MESLLCDEKYWALASPLHDDSHHQASSSSRHMNMDHGGGSGSPPFYTTKEDADNALRICLDKETSYMPEPGFAKNVESSYLTVPRFRAIQWLIKSKNRLRLSYGSFFLAINYFDRFVSACKCQEWKDWMVELLSVACLSIASKSFENSISPSLHEIQMEGLDHPFLPRTIQQMELILLRALGWRISSITPHTYVDLLMWNLGDDLLLPNHLHDELRGRVNELLLLAVSDIKLMEFRPSILAASVMRYGLGGTLTPSLSNNIHCTQFTKFLNQEQKEDLTRCSKLMEERWTDRSFNSINSSSSHSLFSCSPLSPVTVLSTDERGTYNDEHSPFELEISSAANPRSNRKRRRGEEDSKISSKFFTRDG